MSFMSRTPWADEKHWGFGGIYASHSLGNCCASPLPRPSGLGRLQCQDGRGEGLGVRGQPDSLQPPPPPPPPPPPGCLSLVFFPPAGGRGRLAHTSSHAQ